MDHFVVFPVNEDGTFPNPNLVSSALDDAMSPPFAFSDVFIYSHGWWTTGIDAMAQYGQYTIEFAKNTVSIGNDLKSPPQNSFGMGVHWPSTLGEDKVFTVFEPVTYYQMGIRGNHIGSTGLYATIRRMFHKKQSANTRFRLTLIGHSFGCRVVCSALQKIYDDINKNIVDGGYIKFVDKINLVLLQAAFKDNQFDNGGDYDGIVNLPNLRVLVTISQKDLALKDSFPIAETVNNIAHLNLTQAVALGANGPTQRTIKSYSVGDTLQVSSGFSHKAVPNLGASRMLVADLTQLHQDRIDSGKYPTSLFSGSHSDISSTEIYNLIAGFAFQ